MMNLAIWGMKRYRKWLWECLRASGERRPSNREDKLLEDKPTMCNKMITN
jgi:hypothetical protein